MTYWKFVKWEPESIEKVKSARWPSAMAEFDAGNKKPLIELYRTQASSDLLRSCRYRLGGWEFHMGKYCRKYWVKIKNWGIQEVYAPDRTTIRNCFGTHNVIQIMEVA